MLGWGYGQQLLIVNVPVLSVTPWVNITAWRMAIYEALVTGTRLCSHGDFGRPAREFWKS